MKNHHVTGLMTAALLLLLGGSLWGFSFQPLTYSFTPDGRGSSHSFRLHNEGADYIAVRITAYSRRIDQNGNETRTPAGDLFTIYPQRTVLKPDSRQTVRVQWKGPKQLEKEGCFRLLVEQLPVDFGDGRQEQSGVRILFRYLGSLYVTPAGVSEEVIISRSAVTPLPDGEKGERELEIIMHNRGGKHAVLNDLHLTVHSKDGGPSAPLVFSPEELTGLNGENLLPGGKRRFSIALPAAFTGELDRVEFTYDSAD